MPPAPQSHGKSSCHQSHNSCQLKNKAEKPVIIKPETKREKRKMHSEKDLEILGQEGDTNGLKTGGIQK